MVGRTLLSFLAVAAMAIQTCFADKFLFEHSEDGYLAYIPSMNAAGVDLRGDAWDFARTSSDPPGYYIHHPGMNKYLVPNPNVSDNKDRVILSDVAYWWTPIRHHHAIHIATTPADSEEERLFLNRVEPSQSSPFVKLTLQTYDELEGNTWRLEWIPS
ncbi:MAG: hypothetical protein J3Q66DRAFT_353237 [Benniella sp.]|nr:MAG: hypothetical protein J3Q66DRAFT_353237 [Benniella sp.]